MKIYLIGMPGSGKTTVAINLAKKLSMTYVDLDGWIEKVAHLFIEDIFEKYGEEKFRELETEMLRKLPEDNIVVSCGGGIVVKKHNKALMNGLKIYLDTDLDVINVAAFVINSTKEIRLTINKLVNMKEIWEKNVTRICFWSQPMTSVVGLKTKRHHVQPFISSKIPPQT